MTGAYRISLLDWVSHASLRAVSIRGCMVFLLVYAFKYNYFLVAFQDSHGQYSLQKIFTSVFSWPGAKQVRHIRHFHHNLLKFIWDDGIEGFVRLHGFDDGQTSLAQLHESRGYTADEQEQM